MPHRRPKALPLLALLLLGAALPAQPAWSWGDDPAAACAKAKRSGRLVLVLYTVGDPCPSCRALEAEVFGEGEASRARAKDYEAVRLMFGGREKVSEAHLMWAARADLEGYPTVYVLDAEGWPCLMQAGFCGGAKAVAGVHAALGQARAAAAEVARRRAAGTEGLEALLGWYRERGMRLGEWRASESLFSRLEEKRRAALVPRLVAPTIAEKGLAAGRELLELVRRHDPASEEGWRGPALHKAGNLLLRRCDLKAACACFEELVTLQRTPAPMRMEAEMGLGMAYRRLLRCDRARIHYRRARDLAATLDTPYARAVARQAERRLEQLGEPGCDGGSDGDREPCPRDPRQ